VREGKENRSLERVRVGKELTVSNVKVERRRKEEVEREVRGIVRKGRRKECAKWNLQKGGGTDGA